MITGRRLPHPIPYQGSKRELASRILPLFPRGKFRLFEPFAGSAAVSIAAAANGLVDSIVLNDANEPLMRLWTRIIAKPRELIHAYTRHWNDQLGDEREYYNRVRDDFNKTHDPDLLLYILARCVKASVRYNSNGEFNQSPDNRRRGAKPETMAKHIRGASNLLSLITTVRTGDYWKAIHDADRDSVVYMDPPYQGVCGGRDNRYFESLSFETFVKSLRKMNSRGLSYIISYDGRTGKKTYGSLLPKDLRLKHIEITAGVSSQATLLGRKAETVESLYLSQALVHRIGAECTERIISNHQVELPLS